MDHFELKRLKSKNLPWDPCIGIFHAVEPVQGGIIQTEGERVAQEVIMEEVDHPPDCQALCLHDAVPGLPLQRFPADVHNLS